jgi:hypothetical protein
MAPNHAYLINTSVLTNDPRSEACKPGRRIDFTEVADAFDRIPIPWLFCFRQSDLRPAELKYRTGGDEWAAVKCLVPRVSVSIACDNLRSSLSLFERLVGDSKIAQGYWKQALEDIQKLPLGFLTLDAKEVILAHGPGAKSAIFSQCFSGKADALPMIKELARYLDSCTPYPIEDWSSKSARQLSHQIRAENSAAVSTGIRVATSSAKSPTASDSGAIRKAATRQWWRMW